MELREYGDLLRRRWVAPVAACVLGLLATALAVALAPPTHESSATLFLQTGEGSQAQTADQRMASYVVLAESPRLAAAVAEDLGLDEDVAQVQEQLSAQAGPDTLLLVLTARADDPAEAAELATSAAAQMVDIAGRVESRSPDAGPVWLTTAQDATPPVPASTGRPVQQVALGGLLGLLVGVVVALVREATARGTTTLDHLRDRDVAVLGAVPVALRGGSAPVAPLELDGPAADALRRVRAALLARGGAAARTLVVTSALPQEGAGETALALGLSLARGGARVVVVDARLRAHEALAGAPPWWEATDGGPDATLAGLLTVGGAARDAPTRWRDDRLRVLPSGAPLAGAGELVQSAAMVAVLREVAGDADVVLVAAPPVLVCPDAAALAARSGAESLLVVRGDRARPAEAVRAVDELRTMGVGRTSAVLLTRAARPGGATTGVPWRLARGWARAGSRTGASAGARARAAPAAPEETPTR